MKTFGNNFENKNTKNNRASKYKVISLFSLSTLALTMILNDVSKVNSMVKPNRFYGSNGARALPPQIKPSKSPIKTPVKNPYLPKMDLGGRFQVNNNTSSGIGNKPTTGTTTKPTIPTNNATGSLTLPTTGTATRPTIQTNNSTGSSTLPTTNTTTRPTIQTNNSTNSLNIPTTGTTTKPTLQTSGTTTQSTGTQTNGKPTLTGPKKIPKNLTKKQKLLIGGSIGFIGLAGLIGGVTAGLANSNKDNSNANNGTPPKLVPIPEAPKSTMTVVNSGAGYNFIDERD